MTFLSKPEDNTHSANTAGICTTFTAYNTINRWTVETKATNHMVPDLSMLHVDSVRQPKNPKNIFLPNGDVSPVTYTRASTLARGHTITNVFHLPQFKFNLQSVAKLTKEFIFLSFFLTFLYFKNSTVGS